MNRLQACLFLRFLPRLGHISARRLWEFSKSPEAIFKQSDHALSSIEGIGSSHIQILKQWKAHREAVYREEENIKKHGIQFLFLGDPAYPKTLAFCPDAPLVLFYKGSLPWQGRKLISIVGTRSGDVRGEKLCRELVSGLQALDPVIVSGFARGIDIIAHDQALRSGMTTVACLAHGLDHCYPSEHKKYTQKIEQNGAFISEFTVSEAFDRKHFLIRNRIIAGLSHATVVVQSKAQGGSMITANFAHQYQRELFAFPGNLDDPLFEGGHQLIRSQKAQLIRGAEDLIEAMGWQEESSPRSVQKKLFIELSSEEQAIFDRLKTVPKESLDNIALHTQNSVSKTATLLLKLEMKGCVKPLPGKFFEWI